MSSDEDPRPLLNLLSVVTQREREALVSALAARGFDGVALPGLRLLAELREGSRSVQALADATGTTKQFCAREVKKLEAAGYLKIAASPDDGRVTLVALSAAGHKLLAAGLAVKRELDSAMVKRLGAADARTLRRLLVRLADG